MELDGRRELTGKKQKEAADSETLRLSNGVVFLRGTQCKSRNRGRDSADMDPGFDSSDCGSNKSASPEISSLSE